MVDMRENLGQTGVCILPGVWVKLGLELKGLKAQSIHKTGILPQGGVREVLRCNAKERIDELICYQTRVTF